MTRTLQEVLDEMEPVGVIMRNGVVHHSKPRICAGDTGALSATVAQKLIIPGKLMTAATPYRVRLQRTKGWRMPPNTVKVDRTTRWGNPFRVGQPPDEALAKQ